MAETGWTKEFPSLRYGSWFWLRDAPDAEPRLIQLCGGYNFYEPMGIVGPNTEYLGPVLPSDFEQLTRLRQIAKGALQFRVEVNGPCNHEEYMTKLCTQCEIREALAQRNTGGK